MDRKKIIIIDDEAALTRGLKISLEDAGRFAVETVNEPKEALDKISVFKPDLVLLDIVMPEIGGNEIAWKIKNHADKNIKNTPVIFLTAALTKDEEKKCPDVNIAGIPCIAKPVKIEELIRRIEQELSKAGESRGAK